MRRCCGARPDRVESADSVVLGAAGYRPAGWDNHEASRAQRRARYHIGAGRQGNVSRQSPGCATAVTAGRILISERYRVFGDQIAELPRSLDHRGVTLHSGRNLIKRLSISNPEGESIEVVVKAFAVPTRLRGFVYAHLRRSKALRCMSNAKSLVEKAIETPDPIACIEYQDYGCLRRSHYISRYWHHDHDLTALLYRGASHGPNTHALLEQLVLFTAAQHDHGVLHLDYNPGNILVRARGDGFEFALVDLNRLRFKQLGMNDRISGLVRLTTIMDYLRIIGRRYAVLYGLDPDDFCRRLEVEQARFVTRRRRMKRMMALLR